MDPILDMAQLEAELMSLSRERATLRVGDDDRVAVIRSEYGARIRTYREQHRQQAA